MKKLVLIVCLLLLALTAYAQDDKFLVHDFWPTATLADVERELAQGADIYARNYNEWTPLIFASSLSENPEIIEVLIAWGADIHDYDDFRVTSLHHASSDNENPEVIEVLLAHGANIHAREYSGWTPLGRASAFNENPEVIAVLLDHGADIHARNDDGMTALMVASSNNETLEVIELLLEHGATPNTRADNGMTAIMFASRRNKNLKIIEVLLEHGADIYVQDNEGKTALDYARDNDNPAILEVLENAVLNHQKDKNNKHEVGNTYSTTDNLRVRDSGGLTGNSLFVLPKDTPVKVIAHGASEVIDGLIAFWLQVEVAENTTDTAGNKVAKETKGWLFGGYVSMEKEER